ncbi:hypothetical protein WMY93_020142 [Mugilogobius chulae]|uniref:Uncharacterized protein n=1 Tax=Mugilogobius chulae TaxID=88201 RepID=A0AAW0NM29_9GOBI
MEDSNPDWIPSLHLGHNEVSATKCDRHLRRVERMKRREEEKVCINKTQEIPAGNAEIPAERREREQTEAKFAHNPGEILAQHVVEVSNENSEPPQAKVVMETVSRQNPIGWLISHGLSAPDADSGFHLKKESSNMCAGFCNSSHACANVHIQPCQQCSQ